MGNYFLYIIKKMFKNMFLLAGLANAASVYEHPTELSTVSADVKKADASATKDEKDIVSKSGECDTKAQKATIACKDVSDVEDSAGAGVGIIIAIIVGVCCLCCLTIYCVVKMAAKNAASNADDAFQQQPNGEEVVQI